MSVAFHSICSSNTLEWDSIRLRWKIKKTRVGETAFLHPLVGYDDLISALEEYADYKPEDIHIFAMEKIHRKAANAPVEFIQCNPRRKSVSRHLSTNFRQVFSCVIVNFLDENEDLQPWICRVFGILLIEIPAENRLDCKLIVASMEEVNDVETYLPYPVFRHYVETHQPLKLDVVDINHVKDTAFLVPVLDGKGFEFNHVEVPKDFFDIDSLNQRRYYCLTKDRFDFLTHRDESFYTALKCDKKPKVGNTDKTFVSTEFIREFEEMYGLNKPRTKVEDEVVLADEESDDDLVA